VKLKGGMPPAQVRDIQIQKRESDLVMATFGRGFWVLDDYSALREVSAQAMGEEARLFPMRHAYQFQPWGLAQDGSTGLGQIGGNYVMPNPPYGAVLTYNVRETLPENTQLVANIMNAQGTQVQRITLDKTAGLHRTYWNLGATPGTGRAGGPGEALAEGPSNDEVRERIEDREARELAEARAQAAQGQGAAGQGAGGQGAGRAGAPAGAPTTPPAQQFGGRGGRGGPQADPGRYRVVIGKLVGETFTPIGQPQFVEVITLPAQNYVLYR